MATLEDILTAKTPADLFGEKAKSERAYQRLLHIAHPDMYIDPDKKKQANAAFIRLNELWDIFNNREKAKTTNTIKTKKHEFALGKLLHRADGFSYFETQYDAGFERAVVVIPQSRNDNDLIENAATKLRKLRKEVEPRYLAFFPEFIEAFKFTINSEVKQLIAYKQPENLYSLSQVLEDYPEGIHEKDVAWMFRRLLVAIGNTHEVGLIHGGITLDSILIEPEQHGLVLTNWQYSVEKGEALTAIPLAYKANYPQYVLDKEVARRELDIRLGAKAMDALLTKDAPKQFRAFFKGCQINSLPPANELLGEFDTLLERMYGPKKFHPFEMKRK